MLADDLSLPPYVRDRFAWRRRLSREVRAGEVGIGGRNPIMIQSMCTTPTQDVAATIAQCIQLAEAGCQLVRITAPGVKDAAALKDIRQGLNSAGYQGIALCADIHFMPKAAMEAIEHVEKVRVNPGNFADKKAFKIIEYSDAEYAAELERVAERFRPLVLRARTLGRALRIGVNHGSLSDRIMNRFGDTPAGMVESAMEFIRIAEDEDFRNLVISMKSSNPKVMVAAYRMLCARLEAHGEPYPLHLGVTEAGGGLDGRIKGAAGIGALLEDGIGDTIRVSLTEDPVCEIPVAKALARRYQPPPFVADGLSWPPQEHLDPLQYQRRVAEIIRVGPDIPVGGGQLPIVLGPTHRPDPSSQIPADALVADPYLWGSSAKGPVPRRSSGLTKDGPKDPLHLSVTRVQTNDELPDLPSGGLLLLDLSGDAPEDHLRAIIPKIPANILVGLGDCGLIGASRAYRLLAALIEEHFRSSEHQQPGSGIRQPIAIVLGQNRDPLALAAIAGCLLIDGIGDAIYLPAAEEPVNLAFTILQAVKARTTRTDYVACPSCGRTLFDLVETTAHVQEVTNHLDGVTIAIMGCIVNGPGEMADADFGFVGSGPAKIDLYRGREKVRSNVPFAEARAALVDLIKEAGMWKEPAQQSGNDNSAQSDLP